MEVGERDDGAVRGVFEEESGGEVRLEKSVEGGSCGGRDGNMRF